VKKFLILLIIPILACGQQEHRNKNIEKKSDRYINISTGQERSNYYGLKRKTIIDDKGSKISFSLPEDWLEIDTDGNELTRFIKVNDNGTFSTFYIKWLESYNTSKLSDKNYADVLIEYFDTSENKEKFIKDILPKKIFKNLQVVDVSPNLLINSKHFVRRVIYYVDSRNDGTELEDLLTTEFMYASSHRGRRYNVFISFNGDDRGSSESISLFNSIAGTIEFK